MPVAVAVLLSYVSGSIPAAYLVGRARGIDLRQHGSGNLGATNVMRVLGTRVGAMVLLFDAAKGAAPVALLPRLVDVPWDDGRLIVALLCGSAAILGHVRPVFLGFGKGGKGVATASGVFVALAPVQMVLTVLVFCVVVLVSGYVSLGSLVGATLLPALLAISVGWLSPLFWVSVCVGSFVFWTHRANIARLYRGEEHRFGAAGGRRPNPTAAAIIGVLVTLAALVAARFA